MQDCLETDVLIIGGGIAGGVAALTIANAGHKVILLTRSSEPSESSTWHAQGGIIYKGQHDSSEQLTLDVQHAGGGYCYPPAVKLLTKIGPTCVEEVLIKQLGVQFDRYPDTSLEVISEGGHSQPRIIHVEDATGRAIQERLIAKISAHPHITTLFNHTAIDLLAPHHHAKDFHNAYEPLHCIGAYALNQTSHRVIRCLAKATVLASGGLGQIFLCSTNPIGARGDGLAMAYRMGARVLNNEFIQFHPTTFYHPGAPHFLISEAVRGAGARLVDSNGQHFMEKYDSKWKDLAPRDLVSRSIHQEMLRNGSQNVYLDLASYLSAAQIRSRFPNIYARCKSHGIDITTDLIPVVPAAHYACGGVWVDLWGRSTINCLYAVGEVSCTGVHGANRLASTSLLEGLVWGYQAAQHIDQKIDTMELFPAQRIPPWEEISDKEPDPALISQDMSSIKHIMWNYVGLVRNRHRLDRALRDLQHLEIEIERFYRVTRVTDALIGLRNAVRTAMIVTNSARENRQSIGCHFRED